MATPTPHLGGPIVGAGVSTVLAENRPVSVVSDSATCNGPSDVLIFGSSTVLADNRPVVRMGDPTAHGGVVIMGAPTVLVGAPGAPPQVTAMGTDRPFCEICENEDDDAL